MFLLFFIILLLSIFGPRSADVSIAVYSVDGEPLPNVAITLNVGKFSKTIQGDGGVREKDVSCTGRNRGVSGTHGGGDRERRPGNLHNRFTGEALMKYDRIIVGPLEVNCYLVYDENTNDGVIIDPGGDPEVIKRRVEAIEMKPVAIVNTHTHVDHIGANADMKETYPEAEIIVPEKDLPLFKAPKNPMLVMMCRAKQSPEPNRMLNEGDEIVFGNEGLTVIETPGHTIGSICLYSEDARFFSCYIVYKILI